MLSFLIDWMGNDNSGAGRKEKRGVARDPAAEFWRDEDVGESTYGLVISRRTILAHPAVWGAVQKGSRSLARIPCNLYQRSEDGEGKEHARNHPVYRLLKRQPYGREMTPFQFFQTLAAWAMLGDGYAYISRGPGGVPESLLPIPPDLVEPVAVDGATNYLVTITLANGMSEERSVPSRNMIHVRGMSADGRKGYELTKLLASSFGLAMAQREYRGKFFENYARPSVALMAPAGLSDGARRHLIDSYRAAASGISNAHRAILLEEGVKIETFSATLRDAQAIEAEEHELIQVANIFGIPPHKLGASVSTSYGSLSEENQNYLDEFQDPWWANIEQELALKLLTDEELAADQLIVAFNRRAVVRANLSERFRAYNEAIATGWLSRDEARAAEDMNPIPGGAGQTFLVPSHLGSADPVVTAIAGDEPAEGEEEPSAENTEDDERQRRAVISAVYERDRARMRKRLAQAAVRAAKTPATFLAWLGDGLTRDRALVERALAPTATVLFPGEDRTEMLFAAIRSELLDLAGQVTAAQLHDHVRQWAESTSEPGDPA